ncbi:MAG TPA: 50S ribosomal protein L4 [Candidatus Omnitrophota bacterium]|nr:50S ribosomal protein L4 [Candidatus Omnitrophota bacterium]
MEAVAKDYLKIPVYKKNGEPSGEQLELPEEIFGVRVNEKLLAMVLKAYAANQRRGTHDTKERKEVRGGGKKPWKQKGTGRARAGSTRSPLWRGGGTIFGPHPRDYSASIPKELKRQALISALSRKAGEKNILVAEEVSLEQPKTKELFSMIKALKLDSERTLCLVLALDEKLKRASGNLREIFRVKPVGEVSAHHLMQKKKLLIDRRAFSELCNRIASGAESKKPAGKDSEQVTS